MKYVIERNGLYWGLNADDSGDHRLGFGERITAMEFDDYSLATNYCAELNCPGANVVRDAAG